MSFGIRYFYDLPVYRVAEDRYYKERARWMQQRMFSGSEEHQQMLRSFYEKYPDRKMLMEEHQGKIYGGAWRYNEIIGYIRLHFLGSQIRGEYFAATGKRVVRTRKKILEYRTHKLAPEVDIPFGATSEDIYALICEYLADCRRELKGRFIDVEALERIGPYVNWSKLYQSRHA